MSTRNLKGALPNYARYFSTNVTTANISAFGAPYFISVSLKTLLPYAMGRRTVLPFHSCSWCNIREMATTDASVSRTHMPSSVGMPSTGASHSSRFMFSKATCASSFHSNFFHLLRIRFCIGYTLSAYPLINSR